MAEKSSWYSPQFTEFVAKLKGYFYYLRSTPEHLLNEKAKAFVGMLFQKHAFWHSFGDAFFFASVCGILTLIPALLMEEKIEEATSSDGSNTVPVNS
jgi:DHA2 family multidrug resistance protein